MSEWSRSGGEGGRACTDNALFACNVCTLKTMSGPWKKRRSVRG